MVTRGIRVEYRIHVEYTWMTRGIRVEYTWMTRGIRVEYAWKRSVLNKRLKRFNYYYRNILIFKCGETRFKRLWRLKRKDNFMRL